MKTFYTINSDGKITQSAAFKFSDDCLGTDREIVRGHNGQLYFAGEEPVKTLDELKAEKLQEINDKKWSFIDAGITVNGISVATDHDSRDFIGHAVTRTQFQPEYTVDWKISADQYITLDAQALQAIGIAVQDHVESGFAQEKEYIAQVKAAVTEAELDAIVVNYTDNSEPEEPETEAEENTPETAAE